MVVAEVQIEEAIQAPELWRDVPVQLVVWKVDSPKESEAANTWRYLATEVGRIEIQDGDTRCVPLAAGDTRPAAVLH